MYENGLLDCSATPVAGNVEKEYQVLTAIWGILAPSINASIRSVFDQMTGIMPFSGTDSVRTYVSDRLAVGHSSIGTFHRSGYPVHCSDGQIVALCGTPIWEGDEANPPIKIRASDDAAYDAELVQVALRGGRLADVGGVYAFVAWDPIVEELCLGTDRLGFRGLYYMYDEPRNVVFFASRLRGLTDVLDEDLEPNWKALLEFLHFGHPLGNKTFFVPINLVPASMVIRFSKSGVRNERYWDINSIAIDSRMSYRDAIEVSQSAFLAAMRRRIRRASDVKTIVLLSGGADSRRIAGELIGQDVEFETFTTRGFSAVDTEGGIAAAVARALRVENTFVDLPREGFVRKYWSRSNRLVDYESCLHQWLLPLSDALPSLPLVNYDGIAGDIAIDVVQRASGFYEAEQYYKVAAMALQGKVDHILGARLHLSFLKDRLRARLDAESIEDSVVEALRAHEVSENQLMLFFLLNRTRRGVALAPTRVLQNKIESLYPFLDRNVLEATLSIPLVHRLKHTLRQDIVRFAYPKLGNIPYTQYKQHASEYTRSLKTIYRREKLRQLRSNIWLHFLKTNIAFKPSAVGFRFASCVALSYLGILRVPYEFSLTFQVFYDWLNTYGGIAKELGSKTK